MLLSLLVVAAPQRIASSLTDTDIAAAIDAGDISKHYNLETPSRLTRMRLGYFSTPFSRVAQAAFASKRRYKSFTKADITTDLLAPQLWIHAYPADDVVGLINVAAVVILPKKAKDITEAIHPIRTIEWNTEYQNLFGAKFEGRGLIAVFPSPFCLTTTKCGSSMTALTVVAWLAFAIASADFGQRMFDSSTTDSTEAPNDKRPHSSIDRVGVLVHVDGTGSAA